MKTKTMPGEENTLAKAAGDLRTWNREMVRIREAKFGDVEAMVDLLRKLFALEPDFIFHPEKQRRGLIQLICQEEGRCLLVAEVNDQVVGMCSAQTVISTAQGEKVAWVEDVIVLAEYRCQGIGTLLLQTLEQWARYHGITRLQLLVDRENTIGKAFYGREKWQTTRLAAMRKMVE